MFKDNLISLRKQNQMTQGDVARALSISRQTLSKWESGESVPDIEKGRRLAELFGVTLDELTSGPSQTERTHGSMTGRTAFGTVRIGDKGQLVIPARARRLFDIRPGDRLIVWGGEGQSIALMREGDCLQMAE